MQTQLQIRKLSKALLISGTLNIAILTFLFYWIIKESPPTPYCEQKPANRKELQAPLAAEKSNAYTIRTFRTLSLEQLILRLGNTQLVENGFTQRDLALSALVSFHFFDLQRALLNHSMPLQQRKIPFGTDPKGKIIETIVYPGLSDEQFQAIHNFALKEKWPLTTRGLLRQLRKQGEQYDPTLLDALYLSSEFSAVETLFSRSHIAVNKSELIPILLEGHWKLLAEFAEQQKIAQDLTPARRQNFLLKYVAHGSTAAAYLLLKIDNEFAIKKLDDNQVISILNLLKDQTKESEKFALAILTSPRGDAVRNKAAEALYRLAGEPLPEKNLYASSLARFVPQVLPLAPAIAKKKTPAIQKKTSAIQKGQPASLRASQTYTIKEGDSLWKISKKFKVSIEAIKKHNRLQSDFLKPGNTLKIP